MTLARRILLEAPPPRTRHLLAEAISPAAVPAAGKLLTINITRTGRFTDPRYGTFEITPAMLQSFVRNFDRGVAGQDIALDLNHRPEDGAAGYFRRLRVEGDRLLGDVELTDYGRDAIERRGFRYSSAEYHEAFVDNEAGATHGPTLLGAALTVRPAIKGLDRVRLAADGGTEMTMDKWLKKLLAALQGVDLTKPASEMVVAGYRRLAEQAGEDESALEAAYSTALEDARRLSGVIASVRAQADAAAPTPPADSGTDPQTPPVTLSEADVRRLVAEERAAAEAEAAKQAKTLAEARQRFAAALAEAEGLSEQTRRTLGEAASLITAGMSEAQIDALAAQQIRLGEQLEAAAQLSGLGWQPSGRVHVQQGEDNTSAGLQAEINKHLRLAAAPVAGPLRLPEKIEQPFLRRVLAAFDAIHGPRLAAEHKILAGGQTSTADTQLPASYMRTVIIESLSDLNILQLVNTLVDPGQQAVMEIPYEVRDISAVGDGIVYEAQPIPRMSMAQRMDLAYVLPVKIAFLVTNEVMHFTRAAAINWDAWARTAAMSARVVRELIQRRIANEMLRAADSVGAIAVVDESIAAQLDGSTSQIKTAYFPIVQPHQRRDLQGNAVGVVEHPITLTVAGTPVPEYDGSGDQPAGTYYRLTSVNLGYLQLVNEAGTPVAPAAAAATISYSRATNVIRFDLDVPAGAELEKHLNGLVRAVGRAKARMSQDHYVMPDMMLLSPTLEQTVSEAKEFRTDTPPAGMSADAQGDLGRIKGIPAWATNAPGIYLAEERILLGQRGTTTYGLAKPFQPGQPFEHVDPASGRPTGQKQAYGEEYSTVHTPVPVRQRYTSVLAYSATGR